MTSVGSAAWHDVTEELAGSGFGFQVAACDARVQGEWAAEMVAAAIRTLGRRPLDVILVVRGGGARADLATFDSEVVARAIASCPVPVVTGLGHEVDRSVADEVACLALKTPTACAAELVARVRRFRQGVDGTWEAIEAVAAERLTGSGAGAERHGPPGGAPDPRLAGHRLRTAGRARRTAPRDRAGGRSSGPRPRSRAQRSGPDAAPPARPRPAQTQLVAASARLRRRSPALGRAEARTLDELEARVRALDPARALARGWSITHAADGRSVRSARERRARRPPDDHAWPTVRSAAGWRERRSRER